MCTRVSGRPVATSSFPFLQDPSFLRLLRLPSAETFPGFPSPVPESREVSTVVWGWGLLWESCGKPLTAGPLQGCWSRGTIVSPLSTYRLQKSPAMLFLASSPLWAPGAGNCGAQATSPGANRDSMLIELCSVGRSLAVALTASAAALLYRWPGPLRAPGELGQQPREAGAAGR